MEARDIVERLRDGGNDICRDGPMWPGDDMLEAAAELSRLRAEVERLRGALEPFEELSCEGNWDQPDDTKVIVHAGRATCYWLTLADLRRARKALEGGE